MLEKFQVQQPVAVRILQNAIDDRKYAHAYLFEDNETEDAEKIIKAFIKELLCMDMSEEEKNNVIDMIDTNNHPEVKIISSDGLWIKKEQIISLQEEFKKKPLIGNKKIYIIKNAEKLNKTSSNTILKFLEEPENGIIAILITKNIYRLLNTIKSRCQIIKIREITNNVQTINNVINSNDILTEEEQQEKINAVVSFVHYYEKYHLDIICYMQTKWHCYFENKGLSLIGFDLLILYYKDVLNYLLGQKIEFFDFDKNNIENIFKFKTISEISKKLEIITLFKERIKMNANLHLLMDKLVIELEGGV